MFAAAPSSTDWLSAGAAVLGATATIGLVIFAMRQFKAMRLQIDVTREGAARQWYPLVYAHEAEPPGGAAGEEDKVVCSYYLRNEGLGPALNIEHGVEVWGTEWLFQRGSQFRSVQPGASIPPSPEGEELPGELLEKRIPEGSFYPDDEVPDDVVYWCRYESLFGDRWETRNSNSPFVPPEIRRLEATAT